ncbi:glycoside hydrolase family 27 protein [Arsenicicoccus dermatophilus]|uniref:glycoside hydrolase family 27 protein n=1 Tax=Arsenicicoccus dermatophilus TaxID=1076331 RepID=UPI003916EF6B
MGWSSWNAYRCRIDERKIRAAADALVSTGLAARGYRDVDVDDCWQAPTRDAQGRLQGDPVRFPSGMKALADYVHAKGLRLGLYATPGTRTCAEIYDSYPGRLGSLGHEQQDAQTFAAWGVDVLKYDWCRADEDGVVAERAYPQMRRALDATGRDIPLAAHVEPEQPIPGWWKTAAQTWRTTPDIRDSWSSMIGIAHATLPVAGQLDPNHYPDPDMLEVGNGGMPLAGSYRTHVSLWAQLGAPLIIGTDLSTASTTTLALLGNERVIAVDQDPAAHGPTQIYRDPWQWITSRVLADTSHSVTMTNEGIAPRRMHTSIAGLGLAPGTYSVTDAWSGRTSTTSGQITAHVEGHDTAMLRITRVS